MISSLYPNAPNTYYYARSNWGKVENIEMSKSYITTGGSKEDCSGWQKKDYEKVYFAGEATECDMLGTTHGAYLSGRKIA